MQISFKQLTGLTKHISIKRHIPHSPDAVWFIFLNTFAVCAVLVIVWSAILFIRINRGDVFVAAPTEDTSVETFSREKLQSLIDTLHTRQALFERETQTERQLPAPEEEGSADTGEE